MWGAAISAVSSMVSQWMKNKQEKSQAKHERDLKVIHNDASWNQQQAQNSQTSWKDEWFVIVLSVPLIGAFVPGAVPYIQDGFAVLATMPDFYKAYLGGAVAAAFGLKTLANYWTKK